MAIQKGRSDFESSSLDGKANIETGTTIYTLGGGNLNITTNLDERQVKNYGQYTGDFLEPVTLDDIDDVNEVILTVHSDNHPMELNFNKTDLKSYSYFGSLKDKIDYAILNIISTFPASVYVNIKYNYENLLTYINRSYDSIKKETMLDIPISSITNNYNLFLTNRDDEKGLKNVELNYSSYVLWDFENEFEILSYSIVSNYLRLKVKGEFLTGTNGDKDFHIKPKVKYFNEFYLKLNDLEKYLLNNNSTPRYTAIFKDIEYDINGESVLVDKRFTWNTSDGYNLDFNSGEFDMYVADLKKLTTKYDEFKTNIILRELVSDGVLAYDDSDERLTKMLKMMGVVFDEIKQYIDSLAYMTRVSYDKNNNIPDKLVKNLAKTLGWGVVTTYDEKTLINDVVSGENIADISGVESSYTPVETDIELWRRIAINTAYLFKSKGTRNAIEFLFALVGAPKSIIDIREFVYIADGRSDYQEGLAVDEDGYPLPLNNPDIYFQNKGGWNIRKDIAPSNGNSYSSVVGIHTGEYDNGSTYIKSFEQAGFKLTRMEDNSKVHVVDGDSSVLDEVLDVNDRRLVINSKELSTFLTPMRYIENEIVKWYNTKYNTNYRDVEEMFLKIIKPSTHKVIEYNGSYPELYKIVIEYLSENTSISLKALYLYVNQLQGFWKDLVEQMIPSTAIWSGGIVYKNNTLNSQKHTYKHGINFGSEFENEILHFKAPKLPVVSYNGEANLPREGDIRNLVMSTTHVSTLEFPSMIDSNKGSKNVLHIRNEYLSNKKSFPNLPMVIVENAGKLVNSTPLSQYSTIIENGGGEKIIKFLFDKDKVNDFEFFHYNIFKYDYTTGEFDVNERIEGKFTPNQIATATLQGNYRVIEVRHFLFDGEYLIKCGLSVNFSFNPATDETFIDYYKKITEDGIDNLINYVGEISGLDVFNFDTLIIADTGVYGIYDANDYYFSLVEKPDMVVVESFASAATREQAQMITTRLNVHSNGQKTFVLEDLPLGDIFLTINGVALLKSVYRDLRDGGEYFLYYENESVQFKLSEDIDISIEDVVSVTYIKDNSNLTINNTGILRKNNFVDVTNDPLRNYRIDEDDIYCYEYDFGYSFVHEVAITSLVVMLNGVKLLRDNSLNVDFDYGVSPIDERKLLLFTVEELIFENGVDNDDEVIIYYPQVLDDGFYLENGRITMTWRSANTNDEGKFIIQVADNIDFEDDGRYWEVTVPYKQSDDSIIQYSQFVGELDPFLDVNKTFYYRILNEKKNTDLLGNVIDVTNFSYTKTFKTDSKIQL